MPKIQMVDSGLESSDGFEVIARAWPHRESAQIVRANTLVTPMICRLNIAFLM